MLGLAVVMLVCALVGVAFTALGAARPGVDDLGSVSMLVSGAVTGGVGGLVWWWGRGAVEKPLDRREAVLAVALIWGVVSVFGALPYLSVGIGPIDAVFETASGFTTTGSTIVTDIEGTLSRPVLLWRALTQWLGGMGIVVLFVAVFPNLGIGGKHMFRSEVPGHTAEGLRPRITATALVLWRIYVALTALEALLLWLVGMDPFEAVCHALTSLATGGFSTRDASIAAFDSAAVDYVIATFMLLGGTNFALYYAAIVGRRPRVILRSTEFRAYVGIVALAMLVTAIAIRPLHGGDLAESFRYAYFFVASTITTTGYVTDDYMAFTPGVLAIMVVLMLIGGSSGSTAGGIKTSRVVLLAEAAWSEVRRVIRPQVVQVVRLDRAVISDTLLLEIAAFFFVYVAIIAAGTVTVAFLDGAPVPTAFAAMVTTIGNNGPLPFYLGADTFAGWSSPSKVLFIVTMILGRLELFTVLALLHHDMWRR